MSDLTNTSSSSRSIKEIVPDLEGGVPEMEDKEDLTNGSALTTLENNLNPGLDDSKISVDEHIELAALPKSTKNLLLLCFCTSMFIDVAGVTATILMTAEISKELGIGVGDQAWVLGTYAIAFAASLLLAGRLADLYSPSVVYTIGFVGIAILNLIISFLNDRYSFFILRAISALAAVLTIPTGALSNTVAMILAGLFLLASWKWYFRFVTIIVTPFAFLAWKYMPPTKAVSSSLSGRDKLKRLDLIGVILLLSALVLFILGFTQAESRGWSSVIFLVPFLVSLVLFGLFVYWEMSLEEGLGLLPKRVWSFPNIFQLIIMALAINLWFNTTQLRLSTYFQDVLDISPIITGVKMLPMGITALITGFLTQPFPFLVTKPRIVLPICTLLCLVGSLLFAFSDGGEGMMYWKFVFPGLVIGTIGGIIAYISANTCIIQAFPISYAGISGSFANVIFQIGGVIGVAIQAGLLNTGDGTLEDWTGSKNSYFFAGAVIVSSGLVMLTYRERKV
ncbi:hypothetical protein L486_05036 [Kwoniella mangroviensis CBS 10435]|uniref:Major facilitator superfamily (MFS) profile domain-containing protein n=1 Tax=Kwoniella mangroviensis CBS 10435 TaxID=1331196 RepID=A0A1B9IPY3_9TREE|nr:hypothetical protein L486_05036 [Kwoniella mangroviensis CBS 10435]